MIPSNCYTIWYIQTVLYHVIHSSCLLPCDIFKLFIPSDTFSKLFFISCDAFHLFYAMWCIQTFLYHVIPLICFISCDTFKLFIPYDTFKLFYIMWYLQTVVWHMIHSHCFIPCDTCKKKTFMIIILLWGYSQSQFLSFSGTTITVPRYFVIWCIQIVLYHVISSSWFIPCDTFKLCYAMWYPQTVLYHVIHVKKNC